MGRNDQVGGGAKGIFRCKGFLHGHIHTGAGDNAILQRRNQCRLFHDAAPGTVDQQGGGFHHPKLFHPQKTSRFPVQRRVNGDYIAFRQQLRKGPAPSGALAFHFRIIGVGIVGQQFHADGPAQPSHPFANIAESDDSHGFSLELKAFSAVADFKISFDGFVVTFHQIGGQGEHQGQGMLCHRIRVAVGRDHHRDSQFVGCLDIDAVVADAGTADDFQLGGGFHFRPVHMADAYHNAFRVRQLVQIVAGVAIVGHIDFPFLCQRFIAGGAQGLRHDNFTHRYPPYPRSAGCRPHQRAAAHIR